MGETKTQTSQALKAASFKNGVSLHRLLETAPLDALEPFFRDVEDGAHASIFLTPAWPSQRDDAVILELRGHLLQVANSLASDVAVPLDRHAQRILTLADGRGTEALNRAAERLFDTEKIAAFHGQLDAVGRTVAYRRNLTEGFAVSDALRKAIRLTAQEALALAEQYRRHANGVISDMIVGSTEITEQDFAAIVEAGHPPGYTDFRDFIQGDYTYRRALFRAILNSRNSDRAFIDALRVTVDVPDIFDRGTAQITDPAAGASIYFSRSFRVAPEVTMTHKGGTAVAIPRLLGAVTTTGFTAVLENSSGTRVTGSFTWIAQGY